MNKDKKNICISCKYFYGVNYSKIVVCSNPYLRLALVINNRYRGTFYSAPVICEEFSCKLYKSKQSQKVKILRTVLMSIGISFLVSLIVTNLIRITLMLADKQ